MLLLYTCIIQLITEYGSALYKGGIFVFSFSSILPVSQSSFNLVCGCSDAQMKLALNAAVDILLYNFKLHLWKKRMDPSCPLCNNNQSLLHVLNICTVANDLRKYNIHHNAVLQEIAVAIQFYIPTISILTVDIGESYTFTLYIVPTDLRLEQILVHG